MKITLGKVEIQGDIEAQKSFQAVPWAITGDNDEVLSEGVQAFELAATADEITDFATRKIAVYKENLARHEEAKSLQADIDNAQVVAEQISNKTIEG